MYSNSLVDRLETVFIKLNLFNRDPFDVLPNEIVHGILTYFQSRELAALQVVSKRWLSYIKDDSSLWTSCIDFSEISRAHCTQATLDKLLGFSYRSNIKHISLTRFESLRQELECIKQMNRETLFSKYGRVNIGKLIIHTTGDLSSDYFQELVPATDLELRGYGNVDIDCIVQTQQTLEALTLHARDSFMCLRSSLHRHLYLKKLQLQSSGVSNNLLIACLVAYPNLEWFAFENCAFQRNRTFDIQRFCKAASYQSKLKYLAFRAVKIQESVDDGDMLGISSWPKQMTSLVLSKICWDSSQFGLISGSLENLECLKLGSSLNAKEFFTHFNIGKNLQLLHLTFCSFNESDFFLEKCPNLRFISIDSYDCSDIMVYIRVLLNHCSKLEAFDLKCNIDDDELLTALVNKPGLKSVGFTGHGISEKMLSYGIVPFSVIPTVDCFSRMY